MLVRRCGLVVRYYSTSASPVSHPLLQVNNGSWRSRNELVEKLQKSILFDSEHLVALNKPVGLSVFGASRFAQYSGDDQRDELHTLALRNMLEDLRLRRQSTASASAEPWRVVLALEREFSGVTLLAKSERAYQYLRNYYLNTISSVPQQLGVKAVLASTFLAVVRDRLTDRTAPQRVVFERVSLKDQLAKDASRLQRRPAKYQEPHRPKSLPRLRADDPVDDVLFTRSVDPSVVTKTQLRKRGALHRPFVAHHVLARNETLGCALVAVRISSTKWHALEAYLITQRARILGETLYARCISYVKDQPVFVPFDSTILQNGRARTVELDKPLRVALQMDGKVHSSQLPTFVHRYRLVVPRIRFGHSTKVPKDANPAPQFDSLTADLPAHFLYALQRLDLHFDPRMLDHYESDTTQDALLK